MKCAGRELTCSGLWLPGSAGRPSTSEQGPKMQTAKSNSKANRKLCFQRSDLLKLLNKVQKGRRIEDPGETRTLSPEANDD